MLYKKRHYREQLARPKPKRYKGRFSIVDESILLDRLYNNPFRIGERLARERAREREQKRDQNNRLKTHYKHLFKTLQKMKNQTINFASTLNVENFKSNLVTFFGNESLTLIESLEWSQFDCTNKETRSETFKAMLLASPEVSEKLDAIEEQKDKERKERERKETAKAKETANAVANAIANANEEQLQMLRALGIIK